MSEPPRLDYASPPPDEPAKPGRIAIGVAGAVLYGVLLVPSSLATAVAWTHRRDPMDAACPGVVAAFVAWRFTAAIRHAVRGRGRHSRG